MNLSDKIQALSDSFHDGLDEIDRQQVGNCDRLQTALLIRVESGMQGMDGQETIKRLVREISETNERRVKHILAHSSAQKLAESMDFPFTCPDEAVLEEDTPLKLVR